ncbi:hypothetical protein GCM10017673_27320 [Streptosporangium violaceochromogenes]|nr:hypothetical protein GCM10017673_27320 [Streptosporangium violaceochromogenes]
MKGEGTGPGRPPGCREALGLVTDYLDGALPAGRRRRVEGHLARCAGCSVHLEQIRAVIEVLGGLAGGDIPRGTLGGLCAAFLGSGTPAPPEGRQ